MAKISMLAVSCHVQLSQVPHEFMSIFRATNENMKRSKEKDIQHY